MIENMKSLRMGLMFLLVNFPVVSIGFISIELLLMLVLLLILPNFFIFLTSNFAMKYSDDFVSSVKIGVWTTIIFSYGVPIAFLLMRVMGESFIVPQVSAFFVILIGLALGSVAPRMLSIGDVKLNREELIWGVTMSIFISVFSIAFSYVRCGYSCTILDSIGAIFITFLIFIFIMAGYLLFPKEED